MSQPDAQIMDLAAAGPLTHRRVLRISIPIVLSNATVPILGAVDTGVVGQLGLPEPIGAVGIGAIILTSIYWVFGFLRMGTTGLTSQALGARDRAEVAALLMRALMIAAVAGLLLISLQGLIFWGGFALSPASDEVESLARDYMRVRIYSAPAAIAVYGLTGWLIAQERTRAVLVIQVVMNGMNIVLDLWFVLGLDWGVTGVAFATFLSEWVGAAVGIWFCRDVFRTPAWKDWARVFDRQRLKRMALVNSDILIRSLLLLSIFTSFMLFGARFGDVTLASNQVLLQFLNITAYALDGFAFAAEALVGQALGARSRGALRRASVLTSAWGGLSCIVMALAFAIWGGAIIDLMTTAPDVRAVSREYLPWMVAAPLTGVASWMLDGIFIGATRSRDMRNMMVISALVYFAAVLALLPLLGNHGLWLAFHISFIARGATLMWKYPGLEAEADRSLPA
ncbi:MATE family efflux transporter [Pseudooceanicola sp. 216_PA32_1]|uniref:MATE family efflux transporter n=1 Tax=Pseudooceanicola pacificus TaxID=2676438 RepID=A0A844WET7_9RHOB|nr:MATE family efflux transporter [Pseudooceanicola pacificus]MWB77669.1 MATE family efflux transporter [Pseudooceanicola pacificus]